MRASHRLAASMAAFTACSFFVTPPASAAGNYTQNFTTTPASWQNYNDTFAVNAEGRYVTQSPGGNPPQPPRAIAVYDGTTWSTNYTYTAELNSDFESDGNRVGIIFNFVDINHYAEMSISMRKTAISDPDSGHATLKQINGSTSDDLGDYHPAAATAWPTRDTFFPVTVTRSGANTIIKVGTVQVFNTAALPTTAGRIGFFSQSNNGRFDNVSVTDTAVTTLFRSGFNSLIALSTPECNSSSWFQTLSGNDVPGFPWPARFWDLDPNRTTPWPRVFNTGAPSQPGSRQRR